jgi:PKD repeat protein
MKKVSIISFCIIALVAFAIWAPDAAAFQFYSDATNDQGGCAQCHTGFRDNNNYVSQAEGVSWGTSLHNVHLNNTNIDSSCDNCHGGAGTAGRTVNVSSSAAAADGVNAIGCSGCHGRFEDANDLGMDEAINAPGWGAGLRQHHNANGVGICATCHGDADPANFTPAGESTLPPFYGSVINDIVGTNLEPCNAAGEEQLAGLDIGLDNDGNNEYDTADPDCGVQNQAPTADPNGPYTGTVGLPVTFDGSGSNDPDGTIVSYDWDFGDGNTGTGVSPAHTYAAAGTFTVTLTVTDDGGATDSATTTASIEAANLTPTADPNGPYTGTVGLPVTFDGSGSNDPDGTIVSYMWNFGDGNTGMGVNPAHTYADAVIYTVTLTVTDDGGATDSAMTTATISDVPNIPPVADANGPYTGTVGSPVAFDGSGSSDR